MTNTTTTEEDFEAFYERYKSLVAAILSRNGIVNQADLEELAQETFVKAWLANEKHYDSTHWIAIIAKNTAIDFHRCGWSHLQDRRTVLDEDVFEEAAVDDNSDEAFDLAEESGPFAEAFRSLTAKDQTILGLLLQEYKRREIEIKLGLTKMQVNYAIRRARKMFLSLYQGDLTHAS